RGRRRRVRRAIARPLPVGRRKEDGPPDALSAALLAGARRGVPGRRSFRGRHAVAAGKLHARHGRVVAVLRDFPPSDRSPSRIIGGELLAFAASSVLYPFGIRRTRARTARQRDQRTVVLVHGYLGNRSSFYPLS